MRNERDFRRNLIYPITRTRHIPVMAYIIACSAEDLPYMTTKSHRQYIFIQLSIPAIKKKHVKKTLNSTWAWFVKLGKYACHMFQ